MTEVAATLSLPEALLLIRQDNRRQMESLRIHTQSRALANAAIWSKSALRALERFEKSLKTDITQDHRVKGIEQVYRESGVSIEKT